MVMNIDYVGDVYVVTPKGFRMQVGIEDGIKLLNFAYGIRDVTNLHEFVEYVFEEARNQKVSEYITGTLLETFIDQNGKQHFYESVCVHVYACLLNYFGKDSPLKCPYEVIVQLKPEGESHIVDWDNSNIAMVPAALSWDNALEFPYPEIQPTGEDLYNLIQGLIDSGDPDIEDILSYPIVRIGVYTTIKWAGDFHFSLTGCEIDNNVIVATNETDGKQHYAALVQHYKSKCYYIDETHPQPTLEFSIDDTLNTSVEFYNYPKFTWMGWSMFGFPGTYFSGYVFDSIGYVALAKGYDPYGVVPVRYNDPPTIEDIRRTYPDWEPDPDNDFPVSDPPDLPDPPQNYWWDGDIDPTGDKPVPPPVPDPDPPYDDRIPPGPTLPTDNTNITGVGIFKVHEISNSELNQLGAFLWQQNIVESLLNIFKNDPLAGVISLHQLYYRPKELDNPSYSTLKLGYVTVQGASGDMMLPDIVDRYQQYDCGTVLLNTFFNDIRDYQSTLSIYLPFIGMRQLDMADYLTGAIRCIYVIDVYTGDCIAMLQSQRDGSNKVLAVFNGNCASQLPLTGADKSRLFSNLASVGVGVISTIATAGAAAPALALAAKGAIDMGTSHNIAIEKSGSLGGNFGCMGFKTPYLIISRPQPYDAYDRNKYEGLPANRSIVIGSHVGYLRAKKVHITNVPGATDIEKNMIESALMSGVIV